MAMIGPTSSRAPTSAACSRVLPRCTCRSTFSTTTIASSTTRPTERTIARIVSRFRLKPNASITIAAPTSETGMATMRDLDFVAADRGPDADVHGLLIVELRNHVRLFGTQLHARDVRKTDDGAAAIGHDEILELIGGAQIGVGQQVDLNEIALGLAHGGDIVVAPQGPEDITGRQVVRRQASGGWSVRASQSVIAGMSRCLDEKLR